MPPHMMQLQGAEFGIERRVNAGRREWLETSRHFAAAGMRRCKTDAVAHHQVLSLVFCVMMGHAAKVGSLPLPACPMRLVELDVQTGTSARQPLFPRLFFRRRPNSLGLGALVALLK